MQDYNPKKIEHKWQKIWEKEKIFQAKMDSKKKKFFVLDMFPYPSGSGLHVGHPRGYVGTDVISHYFRMKGFNVLHPMGWDAFGLPAENYAIKTGIHPSITTKKNIQKFKEQMKLIGLSYDWSKEINTTDPDYYKWTQWIFLKLFEMGLAYRKKMPVNWCPKCKAVLANEEVVGGRCERCGAETTKKEIEQWVLKITDFSKELLDDLENLDWPKQIKEMQRNWIGKSIGADIEFLVKDHKEKIKVFTTRPDTIFGATFMVLAPEHKLVKKINSKDKEKEVEEYIKNTKKKSDIERQLEDKTKTGVFVGSYAVNPANQKEIPIYIADYVLPYYGYGAIMAVPAHDERDFEFAKKYDLSVEEVIRPTEIQKSKSKSQKSNSKVKSNNLKFLYEGEGVLINSEKFNGMDSKKAGKEIVKWLKEAKPAINYKLRDWVFSRQRYWGEPIPLVFCENCKKRIEKGDYKKGDFSKGELLNPGWITLPEKDLPLKLPEVEKYKPTGTGESPLSQARGWMETKCPRCGGKAIRETNTMPQWAGSCWYFIRYVDPHNNRKLADPKKIKYWLAPAHRSPRGEGGVDFYVGGAEHAVLHLLYSRFWIKALYKAGVLNFKEPFLKLRTIGLILAPGGQKMSKSKGNVINPDDIVKKYGADTFRVYEMFMGPFDQPIAWDSKGILGAKRFLERAWQLITHLSNKPDSEIEAQLHRIIKKVSQDIEEQKFNTAIAKLMEFLNTASQKGLSKNQSENFLKLLTPFAPHITEELWQKLGNKKSIFENKWPEYNKKLVQKEVIQLIIQINGKLRDTISVRKELSEKEAKILALKSEKIQKWLKDKKIRKTIFVENRLINFVIE